MESSIRGKWLGARARIAHLVARARMGGRAAVGLAALVIFGLVAAAGGQETPPFGTAFTYQGRLTDEAATANGNFDFVFALYDAETGGNALGVVPKSAVPVAGGLFTVELDFGAEAFDGNERWLQISVGPSGGASTTLTPRLRITPVPYAIGAGLDVLIANTGADRLVREFPVAAGEVIEAGDVVSLINGELQKGFLPPDDEIGFGLKAAFSTGSVNNLSVAALDRSSFVVAYQDLGSPGGGKAVIGVVDGDRVSFGQPVTFTATVGALQVAALTPETMIVAFEPSAGQGASVGLQRVGTGTLVLSSANTYSFSSQSGGNIALTRLSDTRFALAYRTLTGEGVARTGGIGGDGTITFTGLEAPFSPAQTNHVAIDALSEDTFVVAFRAFDPTFMGGVRVAVADVNGVSFGDVASFHPGDVGPIAVGGGVPTGSVVFFVDGASGAAIARPAEISGTTIQLGMAETFSTEGTTTMNTTKFFDGKLLTAQDLDDEQSHTGAILVSFGDGSVRFGPSTPFNFSDTSSIDVAALTSTRAVVVFRDSDNTGAAVLGQLRTPRPIGIAREAGVGGDGVDVLVGGISVHEAGLEIDGIYYAHPDGTISTSPSYFPIGQAISATEILMFGGLFSAPR
jgi:hypothetical protein